SSVTVLEPQRLVKSHPARRLAQRLLKTCPDTPPQGLLMIQTTNVSFAGARSRVRGSVKVTHGLRATGVREWRPSRADACRPAPGGDRGWGRAFTADRATPLRAIWRTVRADEHGPHGSCSDTRRAGSARDRTGIGSRRRA